jgi:hypothetical protein
VPHNDIVHSSDAMQTSIIPTEMEHYSALRELTYSIQIRKKALSGELFIFFLFCLVIFFVERDPPEQAKTE